MSLWAGLAAPGQSKMAEAVRLGSSRAQMSSVMFWTCLRSGVVI